MKYIRIGIVISLMIFLLIVSCVSNPGSVKSVGVLIPENSYGVIYFQNMEVFLENIDDFFEVTGGIPLYGNIKVKDFITTFLKGYTEAEIDWFDFNNSWALALLPGEKGREENIFNLYVPLKDSSLNYEKVKNIIQDTREARISLYGEYVIITNNRKSEEYTLPDKSIDVSKFKTFSEGSLTCYINLPNIYSWLGIDPSQIKSAFSGIMANNFTDNEFMEKKESLNYLSDILDAIMELEELYINAEIGSDGFIGKLLAGFSEKGSIAEMFGKFDKVKGAKKYMKYISASSLFSSVNTFNRDSVLKYLNNALSLYASNSNTNRNKLDEFVFQLDSLWREQGNFSVTTFDLDIDLSALSQFFLRQQKKNISSIDPGMLFIFRSIMDNLYFYMENIIDIKNQKAYQAGIERLIMSALPMDIIGPVLKKAGVSLSFDYKKDVIKEDFRYDEISINIDVEYDRFLNNQTNDASEIKAVLKIIEDFLESITMYIHYTNNKCYMITGTGYFPLLKEIVERDEFPGNNLYNSSLYERFKNHIPDKAYSIGHFSLASLFSYGRNIPEMNKLLDDLRQKPGIIWYTRYMKNISEIAWFWDIEEISVLMNRAGDIFPYFLQDDKADVALYRHSF